MTNNYYLRRLRYTFAFTDTKMLELWALAGEAVTRQQVSAWLKKDDDPDCVNCSDLMLAVFLNGLINDLRGKKEGPQIPPESRLNNNIILRKLKIALNLRDEDICNIINSGGDFIGKSELSAFFRKVGHRHYRELQDQMMRKFMQGLQAKYRAPNSQTKQKPKPEPIASQKKPASSYASTEMNPSKKPINSHIWKT